jgi:hypothetical protein
MNEKNKENVLILIGAILLVIMYYLKDIKI